MDIVRKTEIRISPELLVQELEQINNENTAERKSHHFVQIGSGDSDDLKISLDTNEQQKILFDLHDALEVIVQKLRGW